ncbi:MFS transporter [Micromonospora sp. NPDC005979]|uniref:MFS transporter n=1 Tax=Micromonospora sp. NPDC005979 TaxID=3156726 RepID=UPI0033ADCC26
MITPIEKRLLRDRYFSRLVIARTAVLLGNTMGPIGLAFGILQLPGGDGGELAILLAVRTAAQVALLLAGGVLADRMSKVVVMAVSDGVAAVSHTATAALILMGRNDETALILLSIVAGAATGAFMPASTAVLPEIVPTEALQPANGVLRVLQNTATISGGAVAAVVVAWAGAGTAVAVNAAMCLVSVISLLGLRRIAVVRRGNGLSAWRDLVNGWHAFRTRSWVWSFVAQFAIVNAIFTGSIRVLGPVIAVRTPNGPAQWALVQVAMFVGLFAGSAVALRVRARFPLRVAAYSVAGFAPAPILLGLNYPFWTVAVALFVTGVCSDLFTVFWESTLQHRIPAEYLSRVSSYDTLGSYALMPLGAAVAAPLAGTSAQEPALIIGGMIIVLLSGAVLLFPSVRAMPSVSPPKVEPEPAGVSP